jgi:hypothetical protein
MCDLTFGKIAVRTLSAALFVFCGVASAATIVLRDGTVIHGEIESLQNGVYTIETDSLGAVRVSEQQVRSIDQGAASAPAPPSASRAVPAPGGGPPESAALGSLDAQAVQSRILQDPQLLAMLLALQNDPDVLAVLADPEIAKEIAAGDFTALMDNPKMIALMNNEKLREIIGQLR